MRTYLVSKIMHQNIVIISQQFNYGKNSFIVLVPRRPKRDHPSDVSEKKFQHGNGLQQNTLRVKCKLD